MENIDTIEIIDDSIFDSENFPIKNRSHAALRDKVQKNDFSDREDLLEKCQDIINYIRFIWLIGNEERSKYTSLCHGGIDENTIDKFNAIGNPNPIFSEDLKSVLVKGE